MRFLIIIILGITCLECGCAFLPHDTEEVPGKLLSEKIIETKEEKPLFLDVHQCNSTTLEVQLRTWTEVVQTIDQTREVVIMREYIEYHPLKELYEIPIGLLSLTIDIPFFFFEGSGARLTRDFYLIDPFMNGLEGDVGQVRSLFGTSRPTWMWRGVTRKGPYPGPPGKVTQERVIDRTYRKAKVADYEVHLNVEGPGIKEEKVFRTDEDGKVTINLTPWLDKIPDGQSLQYHIEALVEDKRIFKEGALEKKSQ